MLYIIQHHMCLTVGGVNVGTRVTPEVAGGAWDMPWSWRSMHRTKSSAASRSARSEWQAHDCRDAVSTVAGYLRGVTRQNSSGRRQSSLLTGCLLSKAGKVSRLVMLNTLCPQMAALTLNWSTH